MKEIENIIELVNELAYLNSSILPRLEEVTKKIEAISIDQATTEKIKVAGAKMEEIAEKMENQIKPIAKTEEQAKRLENTLNAKIAKLENLVYQIEDGSRQWVVGFFALLGAFITGAITLYAINHFLIFK